MSARDAGKSADLTLTNGLYAALDAYRRANKDRSMAAAARRAVRASLGLGRDRRATGGAAPISGKRHRIRLQLEPSLRAALPPIGADETDAILALLRSYLLEADNRRDNLDQFEWALTEQPISSVASPPAGRSRRRQSPHPSRESRAA